MILNSYKILAILLFHVLFGFGLAAQISPGDLSNPHAHLEGISNCTQCHVLGNKVSDEKCLICHTEIQSRISSSKGYHASSEVKGKSCAICHSEHNGKNFQLYRLETDKFDHNLTGYTLSVPHRKKDCRDCHSPKYITDPKIKQKKNSYLGVGQECLTCHEDYHLKTLSNVCLNCHIPETFVPASKFNHALANFKLAGKHKSVECIKCHKSETVNGKKFQQFKGISYSNCTSCHKDPHQNQFGQNCRQCHSEESFQIVKGMKDFDHNKTNFKLEEKHLIVNCKECHKTKFTDPLKYKKCNDCHTDYHKGQFVKDGVAPDCSQCHSVKGFNLYSYTVEQHNAGSFPLEGSHLAIPCFECHKKKETWNFRQIGINCKDCHTDIHQTFIQAKYYPESDCKICHKVSRWDEVSFEHSETNFDLTGAHKKALCRDCHISGSTDGRINQKFSGLSKDCNKCHKDNHYSQFEKGGITTCQDCHDTENWKAEKFDHNTAAFKLDGKHVDVPCAKCHKSVQEGQRTYVLYKLKEFKCESCHS